MVSNWLQFNIYKGNCVLCFSASVEGILHKLWNEQDIECSNYGVIIVIILCLTMYYAYGMVLHFPLLL